MDKVRNMDKFSLNQAAGEGDMDKVRQLIQEGVSVDSRDHKGLAPLHVAAFWEQYEVAELLISNKCDLNLKDNRGRTPLHLATFGDRYEMVELLIRNKCELNLKDHDGQTAVMQAAILHNKDAVGLLLQHGAQVSCEDKDKCTLLHIASLIGYADIVHRILDSGETNPNAAINNGYTPLMCAAVGGHAEVASHLIRAGADANRKNKNKSTALHRAALRCYTGVIQVLLGVEGLELNPKDKDGSTPLHKACIGGEAQVVKQLLEAGADTTIKNNQNETPLGEGIRKRTLNIEVRLFFDHGHFLEDSEYAGIYANPVLRKNLLRDVVLCTKSVVNKFNKQSLPALYNFPHVAQSLPPIKCMKLSAGQKRQVAHFVASEIEAKSFCNVVAARPKVLKMLCVLALITRQA